ncbi:DNA excision repair protein ERCC-like-like protein [Emericellopsis cladophorae]|uniref:DNA excision repair protein ERCC-like-like protein n=1 Tax=Emericellopsis cladophorae TaxID=2686198 RepID=A0A9Q0BHA3_9HYPO|nr:DNA excision repair protein ERCC-like-like protein [Emericellopsis cladophorae]KAI6784204.1 DNA excision repair protein ERCC-like-like protein [Emericellopsis cladophorae]
MSPVVVSDDLSPADTDDSSTEPKLGESRKGSKKRKLDADFSEKIHWSDESDTVPSKPKKRRAKRKFAGKKRKSIYADEPVGDEPPEDAPDLPDYLQARRQDFDARRRSFHEAALKVPPDYNGIFDDEDVLVNQLQERPQFTEESGVKPSRPYEDIELQYSGGLIPASIAQYLRDYQVEGVDFLHRKFVYQQGGILGDDMGLGKTVQVAAFLTVAFGKTGDERDDKRMREIRYHHERWYPRVLIICPGSVLINWQNELNRWGWWHADVYHGARKDDVLGSARAGMLEIMITTYDTYKNKKSAINMIQWDAVVADECHKIKDHTKDTTKALMEVNALCRIGLTGTAIQNKYEEFWTLLDWTNPGQFGTLGEWRSAISIPLTLGQSHDATAAQLNAARTTAQKLVKNVLPQFFLRRMKSLIAHQLPKKTDKVVFCPLTDLQVEAYRNFTDSREVEILRTVSETCGQHRKKIGWCCNQFLPNGNRWQTFVFPAMVTLQKIANHLTLLVPLSSDLDEKQNSELRSLQTCCPEVWNQLYTDREKITSLINPEFCGKWKVLKEMLKYWHSHGDKVLVFSHSVRLLRILQHLFNYTSYNVSFLDGSLSYEERQQVVDDFNSDPKQFVFLISTKAGGMGLNITSANKVVIIDPHWNPSYDLQAQDRAYRIGQKRDVEVFRLISVGTVEEIVYARQIYKQQQANIGYTASSERRYFKGIQEQAGKKGEIFGLENIFTYHTESGLLRDIVNKTNVAEARVGSNMFDVDMDQAAKEGDALRSIQTKGDTAEDGGLSQLAELLKAKDQEQLLQERKANAPRTDAIQAILSKAGVEYAHENSEVVGSSKVEEHLSRRAALGQYGEGDTLGQHALFASNEEGTSPGQGLYTQYNPPQDVQLRQFCEMARTFCFASATEFALVVENWSQEQRRNCLAHFYRKREAMLLEKFESDEGDHEKSKLEAKETKADKTQAVKSPIKSEASAITPAKSGIKVEPSSSSREQGIACMTKDVSSKRASIFLSDDDDDDDEL